MSFIRLYSIQITDVYTSFTDLQIVVDQQGI